MKILPFLALALVLSSCGSTSNLRSVHKSDKELDFSNYNYVIVNDFTDEISKPSNNPNIIAQGKRFADIIASSINSKNLFSKVERNVESTDATLVIDWKITKYNEDNPVMGSIVGFGAGSSCFDAKIYMRDNETKQLLGDMNVNKISRALGRITTGSQDIKSHMNSAATKVGDECALAKKRKAS